MAWSDSYISRRREEGMVSQWRCCVVALGEALVVDGIVIMCCCGRCRGGISCCLYGICRVLLRFT